MPQQAPLRPATIRITAARIAGLALIAFGAVAIVESRERPLGSLREPGPAAFPIGPAARKIAMPSAWMGSATARMGRARRRSASESVIQGLVAKFAACGNGRDETAGGTMPKTIVYVSNADSREITVLRLAEDGALEEIERVRTTGTVMPLALSPDRRFLYAALRSEPFGVASLAIDRQSGRLRHIATAPLPASMPYIATDRTGRYLLSASYQSAIAAVSAIDAEGRVGTAPLQVLNTAPNAHCVVTDPANRFAYVPCLGGDHVMQLRFDAASGRLAPNTPTHVATAEGAGPRHFTFHPDGQRAFLINELDATVVSFAVDRAAGTLSPLATASALPPGFSGKPWAADIRVTPDGRFVYASERTSSTLAGFALDTPGTLKSIGHWPTETQPRGFAIDPSGRFLLSAGQVSNSLTAYAIDAAGGALRPLRRYSMGANPNWVEIVAL